MNILIATIKSYHINNYYKLQKEYPDHTFRLVQSKAELNEGFLNDFQPDYIFFPHWSWIIPEQVFESYNCVVFHMTDLPFGRGGSPLQNLISRGIYDTKISAIKVQKGIDEGDIYLKEPLDISWGNADDILQRVSEIVFFKMIPQFFNGELIASAQQGIPVCFKRRTAAQSEIPDGLSKRQLYDYIRMLDGEGYPPAFVNTQGGRLYLRNAQLSDDRLTVQVEIEENC